MKIVINKGYRLLSYGTQSMFGLSGAAFVLYHEIKGLTVSPTFTKDSFTEYDIKRDDPALVQVVEQLGDEANGLYSILAVVDIPDDVEWMIVDSYGQEHIAEVHRTWR
jgi:hypothetical protein